MQPLAAQPRWCATLVAAVAIAAAAGLPTRASAQTLTPGTYAPLLDAGSPLPGVTGTQFGWADIALNGWSFPYYAQLATTIGVNTQGYLMVGSGATVCGCASETGGKAGVIGPGCQLPEQGCLPGVSQCGGGCCGSSTTNCDVFGSCGGGCCAGCDPQSPQGSRGALIEPFADANLTDIGVDGISYLQGENDAGHYLTVDYDRVRGVGGVCDVPPCGASSYQFQVTLQESGTITFSYGETVPLADAGGPDSSGIGCIGITAPDRNPITDTEADFYTAATGCVIPEDVEGFLACSCDARSWPSNSVMVFGRNDGGSRGVPPPPPAGTYLLPQPVRIIGLQIDAGSLSFAISTQLFDVGASPASGRIGYLAYLTPEPLPLELLPPCSGPAPCLGTFGPFQANVPVLTGDGGWVLDAGPILAPGQTFVVEDPPNGIPAYYYVEVWVDPAGALGTDNPREAVAISAPLPLGVDLTGSIGSLPNVVSASKPLSIPITLENLGLAPASNVDYQVYLTAGAGIVNSLTDYLLPPGGTASLGPEGTSQVGYVADIGAVPNGGVPKGSYYVTLSLPTAGDLNPLNNVASGGPIEVSPAHLVVSDIAAPTDGFPGHPTDVSYTLANTGADDAPVGDGGFTILTLMHLQTQGNHFNRSGEPQLQELDGVTVAAGCIAQITDARVISESTPGCCTIPPPSDGGRPVIPATMFGSPTAAGQYVVGVYADPYQVVKGADPLHPPQAASSTPTTIANPAPDYTVFAGDLIAPPTGVAGEQLDVQVAVSNIGILAGSTPYGYFMSSIGEVDTGGVPIPVRLVDGGFTYRPLAGPIPYQGSGQPDQVSNFDALLLPSGMPTATYTLTVAIDPDHTAPELSRDNNLTAAQGPIQISADPLQISTNTRLPSAEVDVPYSLQLVATGGLAGYQWSVLGGTLPAGFTFSATGVISGAPTSVTMGNYSLLVQVQSGSETQLAALLLAVTNGSVPIAIATEEALLPPATVGLAYEQQLAAQGGVPPYVWAGTPPGGGAIVLERSGVLSGTPSPSSVTSGPASFTVSVTDQIGNTAQAALSLDIISASTLTITTDPAGCNAAGNLCPSSLDPQMVGEPMQLEFTAVEAGTHQFSWEFPPGQALPPGVSAVTDATSPGDEGFAISGTPAQVGVFPFRLLVSDEQEHSAERHFILVIASTAVNLPVGDVAEQLPDAVQGQPYPATKLTTPQPAPISFARYAGDLPPGLSLAVTGVVSGTCATTAPLRPFAFVVSASDSSGNQALLPFAIAVDPPKSRGCSTGGGMAASWLVLLGLLRWRRRPRWGVLAALGLCSMSARASAQSQPATCSYQVVIGADAYVDISKDPAAVSLASTSNDAYAVTTPLTAQLLPFALLTPGGSVSQLFAWSNGLITDSDQTLHPPPYAISSGCSFPFPSATCAPPDVAIAPWWGDLSACASSSITKLVSGDFDAGTAVVTVQWQDLTDDRDQACPLSTDGGFSTYSFQAKLFQTGDVELIYGTATVIPNDLCGEFGLPCSFSAGVEAYGVSGVPFAQAAGSPALDCNSDCQSTSFPNLAGNGYSVSFLMESDVEITALGVGSNVSIGGVATFTADIANVGAGPAPGVSLGVYFSTDGVTQGPQLGAAIPLPELGGCTPSEPVAGTFTLPAGTTAGVGYLIAVATSPKDLDQAGKTVVSAPFNILAPESNYAATSFAFSVGDGGSVAPGAILPVSWEASNTGAAPHPGTTYAYVISKATAVTSSDLQLAIVGGETPLNLAVGASQPVDDQVQLPSTLPPGSYTVGVIIDPDDTFVEQSKLDNLAIAPAPLLVISPTLAIATTALPPASLGISYQQTLQANGGDGTYTWTGTGLPAALDLAPNGTISGSALATGSFPLSVTVTDGQGRSASAQLTLTVASQAVPLAIVTSTLPGAQVDVSYQLALSAAGGVPPYQWCGPGTSCAGLPASAPPLTGVLPPGFVFSPDGVLLGVAEADGTYAFQVAVFDSATPPSFAVSLELPLHVTASGAVSLATSDLPTATLGAPYVGQLATAGAAPPVTWTLIDDQRLPSAPGDVGADLQTSMPSGLTLEAQTGQIVGTPLQAGNFVLLLQVSDSSVPPEVTADNVLLTIVPDNGLTFLNSSLPAATIGTPYEAVLDTNAVDQSSVAFVSIDTAGHDTPAARATLPPGLTLSPSGGLTGTPTFVGSFTFLIEATDDQGRIAIQAFFVPVSQRHGGCSTSLGEANEILILIGALIACRRRRD